MPKPGPAIVYRFFDGRGVLLYVGITQNFGQRWAKHERQQLWWAQVARSTLDIYPDWATACGVESTAIGVERPVYNLPRAPVVTLHILELLRMFDQNVIPDNDEMVNTLMRDLARALSNWLGRR